MLCLPLLGTMLTGACESPAPNPTLQATTAAVLPLHEDNDMKSYLLLPAKRRELLHQHGGHLTEACHGSRGLELLLQVGADRPASLGCGLGCLHVATCNPRACLHFRTTRSSACTSVSTRKASCAPSH